MLALGCHIAASSRDTSDTLSLSSVETWCLAFETCEGPCIRRSAAWSDKCLMGYEGVGSHILEITWNVEVELLPSVSLLACFVSCCESEIADAVPFCDVFSREMEKTARWWGPSVAFGVVGHDRTCLLAIWETRI